MTAAERPEVEVRDLGPDDLAAAIGVLARGMRDNPMHVATFGDDAEVRRRSLERVFTRVFRVMTSQAPIGAYGDGGLLGVTGVEPAGHCQPTGGERLRLLPTVLALGPRRAGRTLTWLKAWGDHDLAEPHSHLGPLAVDAHLQGRGVGTRILGEYCRRLDDTAQVGYLETDKRENVVLYERHGFVVTGEAPVIGVPNWFMRREPGSRA